MRLKTSFLLASALGLSSLAYAERITVITNFSTLKDQPQLMIISHGLDNNAVVVPYVLHLNQPLQGFTLPTRAHVYKITELAIQYPDKTFKPCHLNGKPIIQKDTHILLSGDLSENHDASCSISYSISLAERTSLKPAVAAATSKGAPTPEAAAASTPGAPPLSVHYSNPGMVRYLTQLKNCTPGFVNASNPITHNPVIYHITGKELDGHCHVTMQMPVEQQTLNCTFSPEQAGTISSAKYINMFNTGNLQMDPDDAASKIYAKQCQAQ